MSARQFLARGLGQAEILALTLDAEARNGGVDGMTDVGAVIANRVAWGVWGPTVAAVCLFPEQFSCWNPAKDRNHLRLVSLANDLRLGRAPEALQAALEVAQRIMTGAYTDETGEADHYFAPDGMVPKGRWPFWAFEDAAKTRKRTPTADRHGHLFFKLRKARSHAGSE